MRSRPADLWPPALLSEAAAAAYLSISATFLRSLVAEQAAPAPVRVGARRLYRRADLDAWVAALPSEGERAAEEAERCADRAFGLTG